MNLQINPEAPEEDNDNDEDESELTSDSSSDVYRRLNAEDKEQEAPFEIARQGPKMRRLQIIDQIVKCLSFHKVLLFDPVSIDAQSFRKN